VTILAGPKIQRLSRVSETLAHYRWERGDGWGGEGARVRVQERGREFVSVYV